MTTYKFKIEGTINAGSVSVAARKINKITEQINTQYKTISKGFIRSFF